MRNASSGLLALAATLLLSGCHSPAPQPVSTAVGKPLAAATSRTLGSAGGESSSADGRLSVRIPAGALDAPRAISLQPISNQAPGGRGSAWRLEPSGSHFAKPVQLVFHYTDQDLKGSAPQALTIASQDAQGHWWIPRKPVLDEKAHTVSVAAEHFSDWSLLSGFQLDPDEATVKAGHSVTLREMYCTDSTANENGPIALLPCEPVSGDLATLGDWQANGVAGGDAGNGTVQAHGDFSAIYTAPQKAPGNNPVAVSAQLQGALDKTRLIANITVVDQGCGQHNGQRVPCRIRGSASAEISGPPGTTLSKASGEWQFDYWAGDVAMYKAVSGRVDAIKAQDYCTFEFSPASYPLNDGQNDNSLSLDFSTNPATMTPGGATTWTGTISAHCPPDWPGGSNPPPQADSQITAFWAVDDPGNPTPLQADGTLRGSFTKTNGNNVTKSNWEFHAE
ncbi:MAG TPA: hypothetical protein VFP88_08325 [Rhodanobacteraceae bacterium]|nr:hypothetical protein [Rhodanobacteraceae bacterium]